MPDVEMTTQEIRMRWEDAERKLEALRETYRREHQYRLDAEEAAETLFELIQEATCEGDCKRIISEAQKRWRWLG